MENNEELIKELGKNCSRHISFLPNCFTLEMVYYQRIYVVVNGESI